MARYLIRRLVWAVILLVAVTIGTYVVFFLVPVNPALAVAGPGASPARIAEVERFLGLDEPVYVQYGRFVRRLVVDQSLGHSFATRTDVNEIVLDAAPVTAWLVLGGVVFWMLVAVPLGVLAALRPRTFVDRATVVLLLIGISVHPVWIGLVLAYVLGFRLGLTPITGYCDLIGPSTGCGGLRDWAHSLILPWTTIAVVFAAVYGRMIRASVLETISEDYVRTARAKGASESLVLRSHVLRNALLPVVTMLGMDIALALSGAVFVESVFSLPGLGRTAVQAYERFDLPVIQGVVIFATVAIIAWNLLLDLLYAWIDPRVRLD